MQFDAEAYSKHYIVQALFKLMGAYEYDKISVTDIANKAGVGARNLLPLFQTKRRRNRILFRAQHKRVRVYSAV